MIDIHCHILPDVDDGAVDMTESVEMLRIAAECGVTDIIATPHCAPGEFDNYAGEKLFAVFSELCEALSKTGAERSAPRHGSVCLPGNAETDRQRKTADAC